MRFRGLIVVFLISFSSLAQIRLDRRSNEARNVTQTYCRLDYDGARLGKDGWQRIQPLTNNWKQNPDWQGFTIVSQYDILSADQGIRNATVTVKYSAVGRFVTGEGFMPDPGAEVVTYRLKLAEGEWRIDEVEPPIGPHVSKARALAWLKNSALTEKDSGRKAALQQALKELGATLTTQDSSR